MITWLASDIMLINGHFKILLPWRLSELLPLQMRYDNLNKSQITGKIELKLIISKALLEVAAPSPRSE